MSNDPEKNAGASGQPEFFETDDGDIISHDHYLNQDGEALHKFLVSQASKPPRLILRVHGSHPEAKTRYETVTINGITQTRPRTVIEDVTDFTFNIDLTQYLLPEVGEPPVWLTGDRHAAFRGGFRRQVDNTPTPQGKKDDVEAAKKTPYDPNAPRRKATKAESKISKEGRDRRTAHGLPPWTILTGEPHGLEACIESEDARKRLQFAANIPPELGMDDSVTRRPYLTLREWANEYTSTPKLLKEFTFRKEVYGWNFSSLEKSIEQVVKSNWHNSHDIDITFKTHGATVSIRPDNRLSRALTKKWVYILLWIFLIYPLFIWPFKHFTRWGGGQWRVSGTAFALTKFVHLEDSSPGETVEQYVARTNFMAQHPQAVLKATPEGVSQLRGTREGEFFGRWEETIATLVRKRHTSDKVITEPLHSNAGVGLDGFVPS